MISVVVGLALAVAHSYATGWAQRLGNRRDGAIGLAVLLAGYAAAFVVVIAVLFALALLTSLNLLAMLVTFVIAFSALLAWSVYRLLSKQRNAPPSAGASGV